MHVLRADHIGFRFIFIGLLKFGIVIWYGFGVFIALLNAIWPLLTGLGLAFRVPWSLVMASMSAGLTIYALIRGLGGDGDLLVLFESIANVGILFYLLEGDRPNFIYRHRYRKYSVEPGQGGND